MRANEWNVNKWAWDGTLKVISKGEECIIKLEDKETDTLFFGLKRILVGRLRHAFIGIGFRERPEAYDFQAALHDHQKYLNKKKTAEEMEQQCQNTSSVDYSLKEEGETLKLQIKNKTGGTIRSKFFEQGLNNLSLEEKANRKDSIILIAPPPPPPAPLSPVGTAARSPPVSLSKLSLEQSSETKDITTAKEQPNKSESVKDQGPQDVEDDDFGDFQAAG
ncbi:hypothetical protein K7X08_020729 [Anisodus acutangulus]|uniref:NECAP PHear domain-containing protein n=1 Tax=Anisodus acutangulus TaxID=402998 RepID=A0A9Q1MZ14_9SOLA|nr:hypothetical protein K7X08_020729 [Anisodus acutangulus]